MQFGAGKDGVPAETALEYSVKNLENKHGKVRDSAKKILV